MCDGPYQMRMDVGDAQYVHNTSAEQLGNDFLVALLECALMGQFIEDSVGAKSFARLAARSAQAAGREGFVPRQIR